MAAGASTDHEGAGVVSRAVQASAGIGVAVVFFGMAMGALFAVAYSSAAASS